MPPRKNTKLHDEVESENIVRNFEFFDSDEDIEDNNVEEFEDYDGYDTADEETEENLEILNNLLKEIAVVEVIGQKVYKINFHDTRIYKLEEIDCDCDFAIRYIIRELDMMRRRGRITSAEYRTLYNLYQMYVTMSTYRPYIP